MSEAMIIRRGGANKKLQTKTIAPSVSQQIVTPDSGYDGFESVTVSAITPIKAAQTYTPSLQNQTIAAGQWLTGAQTIQGSANLVAGNIKNGVSIFGVTGTYNGEGFDANGAVLKVITSTNCTILVTGTGYSKTHRQADGFPRSSDANVTEHFFSIPASAFGTITVKATNTYGNNTKTITINTAGKVYELLCGGTNIILNSTFGLQNGLQVSQYGVSYDSKNKVISVNSNTEDGWLFGDSVSNAMVIPISAYTKITCKAMGQSSTIIRLRNKDNDILATLNFGTTLTTQTANITNKFYNNAGIYFYRAQNIYEIIFT